MSTTTAKNDLDTQQTLRIFNLQKANQQNIADTNAVQRIKKLKALHKALLSNKQILREAMYEDFKKHPSEVDLTEIYPVTGELKHTMSHLESG